MAGLLLWFKQDLRLDDHPAVQAALGADYVLPVFILDPELLQTGSLGARQLGVHRTRFLLESLVALDGELRQRGSQLLVLQGSPERLLPQLMQQLDLQAVLTLDEIAPAESALLVSVQQALGSTRLALYPGNGLLEEQQLPCSVDAIPPAFRQFRELLEQRLLVFQPTPPAQKLPPLPAQCAALFKPIPTLSQLGLGEPQSTPHSAFPFSGGEPAGQARLKDYFWQNQTVRQYLDTRDDLLGTEYSSKFSPWLANGCLSVRRIAAEIKRHEALFEANHSTQALWNELLWREFFRWTLRRHGSALLQPRGLKATARAPQHLDQRFEQWCQGRTGMPFVDANMRELAITGYLSNRGRQVVASYLVHDLQQDWRHGAAWFEEHLLDYDTASNWGNWAFLVGVSCDPRRRHAFNALRQARQYDPQALYISLWLPELQQIPQHQRHTPFLLSRLQLDALDYPCLEKVPAEWEAYLHSAA